MDMCESLRAHVGWAIVVALVWVGEVRAIGEVVWAVNCGGEAHRDAHGVQYRADPLSIGTASDYGKGLIIQRTLAQDQTLYQTERYHTQDFGYDVPIAKDGTYVLVMKFSEVWFTQTDQKVFDIHLNKHTVVEALDIFARVGRGVAHDEIVPFTVKGGILKVGSETSLVEENSVHVSFVPIYGKDNPKINALYVMRGVIEDVPQLSPLPGNEPKVEEEEEEEDIEIDDSKKLNKKKRPSSGPKVQDPYASDDTGSMMMPVVLAIGAFIPLLFCLCKL